MSLGTPEILVVVVLVLLLFGPDRLPELMRTVARGMRQVRRMTADFQNHFDFDLGLDDEPPRRAPRPAPAVEPDNNETIPPPSASPPISAPSLPLDQAHLAKSDAAPPDENEKKREA